VNVVETCKISVGKPEGRRPLFTHRGRWENGNKINVNRV
jgi:hypothetical protein